MRAFGDCVALRFDGRSVKVVTLWASVELPWSQVRDVYRVTITHGTVFGLIKREAVRHLVIVASHGGREHRYELDERLLDLPRSGIPALIAEMLQSAMRGVGDDAARLRAAASQTGIVGEAVTAAPVRPQFGRRGI